MKVVESFVQGKRPGADLCEDVLVLTPDFAGVVDGFTDTSGTSYDGLSGGRFASLTVREAIAGLDSTASSRDAVAVMSAALASAEPVMITGVRGVGFGRPCAVVTLYSNYRREVWRVGDAPFRLGDVVRAPRSKVNAAAASFRQALLLAMLAGGSDLDDLRRQQVGFNALRPLLDVQSSLGNRADLSFGYPVLDGSAIPDTFIEVYDASRFGEVIIATDGYPEVLPTLAQSEDSLAKLLRSDPLAVGPLADVGKEWDPVNASYDDRAYVRLLT